MKFAAYFHVSGDISLGISLSWRYPNRNLEIHVPFGFFRIGWVGLINLSHPYKFLYKHYGLRPEL